MKKRALAALILSGFALSGAACGSKSGNSYSDADGNGSAAAPNPAMSAPDEVAWNLFVQVTTPLDGGGLTFESWASDHDTFMPNAVWPTGAATRDGLDAHAAVLPMLRKAGPGAFEPGAHRPLGAAAPADKAEAPATAGAAPAPAPAPAPSGGGLDDFPLPPTTEPGNSNDLIEEVRRNRPAFDYIVINNLNSVSGLKAAFASTLTVNFPVDSIEVKTNWLPVSDLPTYYPNAQQSDFYIVNEKGQPYALIAMHLISKQVPNWTWATFEHQLNPGRCDYMGCHDAFGATVPDVPPADNNGANQGTLYAACAKTPAVQALMSGAGVPAVFANYCLKGSQTDWTDNNGLAVRVANSVTEYSFAQLGSCMTCHGMANFDQTGQSTTGGGFDPNAHIGPIDPSYYWNLGGASSPFYQGMPGVTRRAVSADFVWSIPFCAFDDSNPQQPKPSRCAAK